jgi:hypothetical protein
MQVRFLPGAPAVSTLDAPHSPTPPQDPETPAPVPRGRGGGLAALARALSPRVNPWPAVAVALLAFSTALLAWAGTLPGFDPYGWLVWGHQTLHLTLDTNAAPSWKPLPYLFTTAYALAGHYELRLWMITSVAIALAGSIFAGRIAYKLTDAPAGRRWVRFGAAAFAGLALLGINSYFHYVLSAQSDPMIVALCLGAVDCHLDERPRAAFLLGALAGLGRPEVWAPLGLYTLWCWFRRPATRWVLAGGWLAIALLWFGIPALSARTPFVSAANAYDSGRRLTSDQVGGTIKRFLDLTPLPLKLTALLAVALAALRRERSDRLTLGLAGGVLLWIAVECAFAQHGWPGVPRYMFEAAGGMIVLAGIGFGRLLAAAASGGSTTAGHGSSTGGHGSSTGGHGSSTGGPSSPRLGLPGGIPGWAGALLAAVIVVGSLPSARSAADKEHRDIREQRRRTAEIDRLGVVVRELGGAARLRTCGEPLTRLEYQSTLAYTLGLNVNRIGFKYGQALGHTNPIILFTPYPVGTGWKVQALRQTSPGCRSLPADFNG